MEIELNFRLDENGRTARSDGGGGGKDESGTSDPHNHMDYQSKTILTNLALSSSGDNSSSSDEQHQHRQWLDDLLLDCQISDSGLMPRTFWVPAQGMTPRCHLEQMALDIFHHHVPSSLDYDVSCSGAEWWAQIRPSPEGTGRYSMHDDQPDELSRTGISFHWDKDEDLRLLTGGTTYIHPHLSTVTYLTDLGSPTLALNHRVHPLTGEWIDPDDVEGFVSWPLQGKHLSFDGRYLHAAPADLMEPGSWEKQLKLPSPIPGEDEDSQKKQEKLLQRRHRRVTFLVNVWLNYKPFDIKPFPETMIDKMSGSKESERKRLEFIKDDTHRDGEKKGSTEKVSLHDSDQTQLFTWPMGDCDSKEFIDAQMPLEAIRQQASKGGNLCVSWKSDATKNYSGVRLYKITSGSGGETLETSFQEKRKATDEATDTNGGTKRPKSDNSEE